MTEGTTSRDDAPLPEGTLTFVLTDIEGSTPLWDDEPEAMAAAQVRHDELIGRAVAAAGGRLVKSKGEGDSTFSVFVDPAAAVRAAEAIRSAISAEEWPTPTPLRVRIGVSTGVAELRDGDYFGTTVNRAARVRGLAHGGEVLLSASTYSLVADTYLRERSVEDRGEQELRGMQRPERVYGLPTGEDYVPSPVPDRTTPNRREVVLVVIGALVLLVAIAVWWASSSDDGDQESETASATTETTAATTPTTQPVPSVDIASIDIVTDEGGTVEYEVTGSADEVATPPYEIRVLARDPLTEDTWLWSAPAAVDADGNWTGSLFTPPTSGGDLQSLRVSAVVILPPPGSDRPAEPAPGDLPLTDASPLEDDLWANGPEAAGVVAVSG